jgi:hypothetical protein
VLDEYPRAPNAQKQFHQALYVVSVTVDLRVVTQRPSEGVALPVGPIAPDADTRMYEEVPLLKKESGGTGPCE